MVGLIISSDEFLKLPQKDKWKVLYENQVTTLGLMRNYRFHQKVQYPWLISLTLAAGFMIRLILGGQQ